MKHVSKYLILTILALMMMGSTAIAFAAQNGPEGRGGRFGRGAGGEVTAIEGSTIKVSNPRDEELSIVTNGDTQFTVNGAEGDLAGVQVGMFVHARGERSEDGSTVTATDVLASSEAPQRPDKDGEGQRPGRGAGGEVTAIEGSTIKVTNPRDGELSIATNGDTQFTVNGADGDLAGVQVGMFVHARGERSEDGSTVTATGVFASSEAPQRPNRGENE